MRPQKTKTKNEKHYGSRYWREKKGDGQEGEDGRPYLLVELPIYGRPAARRPDYDACGAGDEMRWAVNGTALEGKGPEVCGGSNPGWG